MADQTSPNPTEESESLDIEIGGEKYTIPKKFAEYLNETQQKITADYKKFNDTIAELKATKTGKGEDDEGEDDDEEKIDTLIFTNPKKAVKKITESIRETVHNDISTKASQDNAKEQFWAEFYKENKDLSRSEDSGFVEHLFAKHYGSFESKTVGQVVKELGDLSRKEILKISRRFNRTDDGDNRDHSIEPILSISKKSKVGHNNHDDDEFDSITDIIKKRRHDRLNSKMR